MKILVMGGMHGNEPLGLEVVDLFERRPVVGVDVVRANEAAIAANRRFVRQDLNRSFPGDPRSEGYEPRRAAELVALCGQYDLVLDFHNTHCPDNDCGFVGEAARPALYKAASYLGLRRIIVADYDCLNKYATNCLSVEISLDSERMDAAAWYERIAGLAGRQAVDVPPVTDRYRFVYRMTLEDRDRLRLPEQNLRAFQPLKPELAEAMGIASPAYPIFIGDGYTPYNYGGLLNKLSYNEG